MLFGRFTHYWIRSFFDNTIGGAVATAMGEEVVKTVGSFLIVKLMRQGHYPQEACDEAIHCIVEKQGDTIDFQVGLYRT